MPSFSSWLGRSRKEGGHIDEQERKDLGSSVEDGDSRNLQRRSTKRELFRKLLKRSSTQSNSNRRSGQSVFYANNTFKAQSNLGIASPASPDKPPTSMADPNKPLPPPPAHSTQPEPVERPVKKLDRIISPITLPDLHELFSGAPQFFVRSEGHHTGAPHPSVAFPWDIELEIRDLSDHRQIHDHAWSSVSAWPHISRDVEKDPDAVKEHREKRRAHYLPRCRERPNMLSMQGLEPGTMGFQAALEMGVADALQVPNENPPDSDADGLADRRMEFLRDKNGVRPLTESTLLELLTGASTDYDENPSKRPTIELYTELFTRILFPPVRVTDSDDPYSLPVQIEALIDVLRSPNIWFDFSLVEWRIRLGQILWGLPTEDEILVNNEVANGLGDQKYWLLLQVLLSCELLLRLDAISADIDHGIEEPRKSELQRFDKKTTSSVRWSLILARQWLENIKIERTDSGATLDNKAPTGWLASFTSSPLAKESKIDEKVHNVQFYGRHQNRQLSGLLHFARKLNWPNLESIQVKVASNGIKIPETPLGTPSAGTPRSMSSQRSSSYFTNRPNMRRGLSKQRMSAMIHPQGWLSNSYISGFILPGEGMSHFLISTLLENDTVALARLGEEANLCGGFIYQDRSFWSTASIVGRVLAAGKEASECMGWVSSPVTPRGCGESWVHIEVELNPQTESHRDAKPRIWHKSAVERDGHIIGGADLSSVLPGDFIIPSDESIQAPLLIKLESFDLFATTDSTHTTPTKETPTPVSDMSELPSIRSYSAMIRFSVDVDGEEKREVNLALSNDVYFATVFPCVASSHMNILKTPTSPSFKSHEQPGSSATHLGTLILNHFVILPGLTNTGHPLHKGYTFTKLALSTVLAMPATLPFTSLLSPPQSPSGESTQSTTHTTNSPIPKVLVIDCTDNTMTAFPPRPSPSPHSLPGTKVRRNGSDIDILARALCAERGWNAMISRRGRVCLSCSVREASALGWRVVLRFA
ncbi:hypothetical protein D0Z07_1625 [Hyphodiscus hymeniophilus]|uniref:Uncharacterized protein n=1 Tax=Hyphodiscus hymeniophilus TaxID=353542 RepID=A0A9P6VP80_9HELO|nr:hypothetical protein D0Z07_1625 [Hyphodiscus hymeniophilus]